MPNFEMTFDNPNDYITGSGVIVHNGIAALKSNNDNGYQFDNLEYGKTTGSGFIFQQKFLNNYDGLSIQTYVPYQTDDMHVVAMGDETIAPIFRLYTYNNDQMAFLITGVSGSNHIVRNDFGNLNEPVLWTATFTSSFNGNWKLSVYRNGIPINQTGSGFERMFQQYELPIFLGSYPNPAGAGVVSSTIQMRNLKIWNRCLYQTEIDLMVSQSPDYLTTDQQNGLIGWWKMNEGSGSIIHCTRSLQNNSDYDFTLYRGSGSGWITETFYTGSITNSFVYNNQPFNINKVTEYTNIISDTGSTGNIYFQLSNDAILWKYYNDVSWISASSQDFNTHQEVENNISSFNRYKKNQNLYVKAILSGSGESAVTLDNIKVLFKIYDHNNITNFKLKTS